MTTYGDGLYQYNGMPVAGLGGFGGLWTGSAWYVDYDNGATANGGHSPSDAYKYLQTALDNCAAGDVIFVRGRTPAYSTGDPTAIIPESTTNFTLAYNKYGTSIIGTGVGVGKSANRQVVIQASSTAAATPTLKISAADCNLENMTFRRGGSTVAALQISSIASYYVWGASINNCSFWKVGTTATNGALNIESAWHCNVENSWFEECPRGILVGTSVSANVGLTLRNVVFAGADSTIDYDLLSSDNITNLTVDRCIFAHDQPALSGGGTLKYISIGTSSTGIIHKCGFGTETATIATAMTTGDVDIVDSWYAPGTNLTDGT